MCNLIHREVNKENVVYTPQQYVAFLEKRILSAATAGMNWESLF